MTTSGVSGSVEAAGETVIGEVDDVGGGADDDEDEGCGDDDEDVAGCWNAGVGVGALVRWGVGGRGREPLRCPLDKQASEHEP